MRLGYNTNGFPHHRLEDAIQILADLGYQSIAITLDHHALNPFDDSLFSQLRRVDALLAKLRLACVIETGARFLLDPWRKHQPTLVSPSLEERSRRLDFLVRAVDIAAELRAEAVSFWSGTPTSDEPHPVLVARLAEGCKRLAEHADRRGVHLAFEPEPGMLIDVMPRFAALYEAVRHPRFGLTLDVGHLHCLGETPVEDHLSAWRGVLRNLHIEDMRRGVHEHLMFGDGEMDFASILKRLKEIGYLGGLHVELGRHGATAPETARAARGFLMSLWHS